MQTVQTLCKHLDDHQMLGDHTYMGDMGQYASEELVSDTKMGGRKNAMNSLEPSHVHPARRDKLTYLSGTVLNVPTQ